MTRKHVVISGTGRSGTTFLVQLFTALGLDTGFKEIFPRHVYNDFAKAGMENYLDNPNAPYIVKDLALYSSLGNILSKNDIKIEHAIIPIRDLYSAAQSRINLTVRATENDMLPGGIVPGGLVGTDIPDFQELVLACNFFTLMHTLTEYDIPVTFLLFPRLVNDPQYLFGKVNFLFPRINFDEFHLAFFRIARPELVHDFQAESNS